MSEVRAGRDLSAPTVAGAFLLSVFAARSALSLVRAMRRSSFAFDLHPYYLQADAIFEGPELYEVGSDLVFQDLRTTLPLTYSLVLKPAAELLSWRTFSLIHVVIMLALLGVGWRLLAKTYKLKKLEAMAIAGLVFVSFPSLHSLQVGQLGAAQFMLVAVAVVGLRRNDDRMAGLSVGILAALKVTGLFAIPVLFAMGHRRAAVWGCVAFVAAQVVTHTIVGWSYASEYWFDVLPDFADERNNSVFNQSLAASLSRLGVGLSPRLLGVVGFASILAIVAWKGRHGRVRIDLVLLFTLAIIDLTKSVTWPHHVVWIAVAVAALFEHGSRVSRAAAWGVTALTIVPFAAPVSDSRLLNFPLITVVMIVVCGALLTVLRGVTDATAVPPEV